MLRCPITYDDLKDGEDRYSTAGLRLLSRSLEALSDLEYTAEEQRQEAVARATKLSIQGVQPKLSARLSPRSEKFVLVDQGGTFILKPQVDTFRSLPENEDLTMRLATTVGIEVPLHGMVFSKDNSLTYFIRRFDRVGRKGKRSVEDFAQLAGASRDTKYDSSMEKLAALLSFATFPRVERLELLKRVLFCFVVGNEDMHLKNWSLISQPLGQKEVTDPNCAVRVKLAPAYDLLNTTLALPAAKEEIALPLAGRKSRLSRSDLLEYFARQRLELTNASIDDTLTAIETALPGWPALVQKSFLPSQAQARYLEIVNERTQRLGLGSV
jgi:serine/threonine-protein kinase HipA